MELDQEPEYDEFGDLIEYYAIRPNKTLIKREITEYLKIAEKLIELQESQLKSIKLDDKIILAIREIRHISNKTAARKRQLKYITGLLREQDRKELEEKLKKTQNVSAHSTRERKIVENWRLKLLESADHAALTEFLDKYPNANVQKLRQLLRKTKKEQVSGNTNKSFQLLYQELNSIIVSHPDD